MNPDVDFYFAKAGKWQPEIKQLRKVILDCQLAEELKWGVPCYTFQQGNIVLIHLFKEYCAVLFFKGALLKDPQGILIQQSENVQAARQIRFTSVGEVKALDEVLRGYIFEAIELEEAGLKVRLKKTDEYKIPEEFLRRMDDAPRLKTAFYALTPGRQRGYLLHFAQAKQAKTRIARIEKCVALILDGKGLND